MKPVHRRPWFPSLVLLFAFGCSSSSSSGSSGCGSSAAGECSLELSATICGDKIALECSGAKPTSKSKCVKAYEDDTQTVYCCDNEAELAVTGNGGAGGS
jgi:hypothetical protein